LDQEQPITRQRWSAVPLQSRHHTAELLLFEWASANPPSDVLSQVAEIVAEGLSAVRGRSQDQRRIAGLEEILALAAGWNQTQDMDTLLRQIAETSTRLLGAERASIFLWDRPNKALVGRPALGVDGGELRIPADAGVVGQVIQTGQSRRVDADVAADQAEIDRHVDKRLGFRTRSLLCVPLRGRSGELFGAFEMINKIEGNFTDDDERALAELATHAAIALENTQEREKLLHSRNQMADQAAERVSLIGQCAPIEALRSTIRRVADTDLAILLLGENGTGKDVAGQMIHYLSRRRNEPYVAVNCAALTETLLESELFGHEKGAFTDAHQSRQGKFELASGGTLFLDEIGDMSPGGQAKLLRVLEEKVVVRVGGSRPIHTDARVIAATNQDLAAMVRERKFREDLFYRLNVVTLELPPLRERGEDVLMLAEHFLNSFCARARRRPPKFTAAARKRLLAHPWPGNIRELRNLMERLAYLSQGDKIDAPDLAFILSGEEKSSAVLSMDLPLSDATRQFQIEYIKRHVQRAGDNMTDAAERLGLHRSNLYRKMRQLGMPASEE
jgi:Nif-specific regulatory protein